MFFGVLLAISYCSYVFLSEAVSLFPAARYDSIGNSRHAIRRRYLGYWSALSVMIGGVGSALILSNGSSSQELALSTLMAYFVLMLPAVILYFLKRQSSELGSHR